VSLSSFLARLADVLNEAGVHYMLSGSLASAYYGTPRSTQDIDIVVVLTLQNLRTLLAALPEEAYYVSETAALDALRRQGQFNVIDLETGWKVDLIVRKRRPFSLVEFDRRVERKILGVHLSVCSPEDSILSKLEWAQKMGGSERQLRDVMGVLEVRRGELDLAYIEKWAQKLGVSEIWEGLSTRDA
jgi:hypothetical protein